MSSERRCLTCGCRLSRYNPDDRNLCGPCARRAPVPTAPESPSLPTAVWSDAEVQGALRGMDFGLLCRLLRQRTGMRQDDLASLAGLRQASHYTFGVVSKSITLVLSAVVAPRRCESSPATAWTTPLICSRRPRWQARERQFRGCPIRCSTCGCTADQRSRRAGPPPAFRYRSNPARCHGIRRDRGTACIRVNPSFRSARGMASARISVMSVLALPSEWVAARSSPAPAPRPFRPQPLDLGEADRAHTPGGVRPTEPVAGESCVFP